MPSRETLDAFTTDEFLTGLVLGLVALALGILAVYLWRRRAGTPAPIVAVLLTGAALAGLQTTRGVPSNLLVGLALLMVAGGLYPWARRVPLLSAVLALPGAWWVTQVVELPGAAWVPWLLFAWIVFGAPLVTSFDRHFAERGSGTMLLLVSIAGIFVTLPDTEAILVVFGVALPLVLLAWPKVLGSLGPVGIYPLLGVLAWAIATGGRGRESAVIGAMACLGLLVVEPLVRWWRVRTLYDCIPNTWWQVPVAAGLQLVVVLLNARMAGLSKTPGAAATFVVLSLLGTAALIAITELQSSARDANPGGSAAKHITSE